MKDSSGRADVLCLPQVAYPFIRANKLLAKCLRVVRRRIVRNDDLEVRELWASSAFNACARWRRRCIRQTIETNGGGLPWEHGVALRRLFGQGTRLTVGYSEAYYCPLESAKPNEPGPRSTSTRTLHRGKSCVGEEKNNEGIRTG